MAAAVRYGVMEATGRKQKGYGSISGAAGFLPLVSKWSFSEADIMRNEYCFVAAVTALALLASPTRAANQRDVRDCEQGSDPDRSIAGCTRALTSGGIRSPAAAFYNRGIAWADKGEFERAIADYNEAIRIDPKYASAYHNRANAWKEIGEYDRGIEDLDEAIRLHPDALGYNNRGFIWTKKGEYDRAIADFTDAIRLDPRFANSYANRGAAWRLKGDLDRALLDQDRAIALDPKSMIVNVERGDTLRYKGDFARAIADYERALRVRPDYIPAFTGLGLTYEKMGDVASARVKFEQATTSRYPYRFADAPRSALETAHARLAALDSGIAQPSIPNSLPKATSATSIPTPAIAAPTVAPATIKTTVARQGRRVALVIGNSAYKNVPALVNPQKDAAAIAASLRNIGFESVTLANDATREKLVDSLRAFADEAEKADWAMVYYAGHGLEVGGVNYLVPTDARLAVDRDIQFEAVPLDQVLAAVDTANRLKLVVLDACRDNPFSPRKTEAPASAAATPTGGAKISSRSIGRGLAEVKTSGGTLVVFAAKNGQVALDGEGDNSPFAVAVLQRVATPGVEINKLFRLVRDDVMEATAGRQEPYTYGSLPGKEDFFFVEK
ncbi:tetratricopeptide repeat protein [Bradyrhizobium sp.]|uniref:tetratricopeptide repeat protein n=1 Tax=Bradyrhizobium sp. TaxID=376 RepID=UPI003D0BA2D9